MLKLCSIGSEYSNGPRTTEYAGFMAAPPCVSAAHSSMMGLRGGAHVGAHIGACIGAHIGAHIGGIY